MNFPEARIDALVLWSGSKDVLEGNPYVNNVYQKNLLRHGTLAGLRFLFSIKKNAYDVSINTHPQSRRHYRMIARIIGAPFRISHLYESFRPVDSWLVNRTLPQDYQRHSVDLNLDVLQLLKTRKLLQKHSLELFLSPADLGWAETFIAENKLQSRKILGIHAGSGGTKNLALKRWPLENYIELVKRLRNMHPDLGILLFGGPDEDAERNQIMAADPGGLTIRVRSENLRQAGALMKQCSSFLSVDTALMHVACAVRAARQIVIEAPTLNKTNEPYATFWTKVPNPAVGGRNLDYYRYDGAGIKGTTEELIRCMASVKVEAVMEVLNRQLT